QQLKRTEEMERRYEMIMPMNEDYNAALCRDEHLRQVLGDLQFNQIDSDSDSTESADSLDWHTSINSRKVSLASFVLNAKRIMRATHELEAFDVVNMEAFRLGVLSGRTDTYAELVESMKRTSIYYLLRNVVEKLHIMQRISVGSSDCVLKELPHQLFKWSMEAFFKRCELPDPIYLEVLMREHSEEVLDWAKFSVDLLELLRYCKYFYKETFQSYRSRKMQTILWDQKQLLNIGEEMDKTVKTSARNNARVELVGRKLLEYWWKQNKVKVIKNYQEQSMEAMVTLPIEWRYVRDYYATIVESELLKDTLTVEKLEKQINEQKQLMDDEQKTSFQAQCVYDTIIENYHGRLKEFTDKLTNETIYWDDKILIAKLHLAKARDDYKETLDKIDYMRTRVQEVKHLLRAEQEAADR
ncbi:hypothetical protein KR222_006078, partial [Zaprionus bogoriensis]